MSLNRNYFCLVKIGKIIINFTLALFGLELTRKSNAGEIWPVRNDAAPPIRCHIFA